MLALWIILYLVVAAAVVFLSVRISKYVDLLDKKTSMSGAIIGGVFLAAVTSIPELFTSISAIFIVPGAESSSMVIGNVLGSDIFNSMVLGIAILFTYKGFKNAKIGKGHIASSITVVVLYGLIAYATLVPSQYQLVIGGAVNIISILLLIVYALSIKFMSTPDTGEDEEVEDTSNLTVKQIVTRFILLSVLLIGASIGITYVTDIISSELNLGKTFAGAIFLGVATSLPELSATISLCKLGNYDAATGNIVGSNTFNFIILVLADIVSWHNPIYVKNTQSILLIILGVVSAIAMCALIIHKTTKRYKENEGPGVGTKILHLSLSAVVVLSYIAFIVLSNVL